MRLPRIQSSLITTRIIHHNQSHDDTARRVASTGDARDATAAV